MNYLKLFQNHSEYEAFVSGGTMMKPNVSHCVSENEVHYNPFIDYSKKYLTTVALEDGTISFNILKSNTTQYLNSISYSTDSGETWVTTNNTDNKTENLVISVNVNQGDEVMWKGSGKSTTSYHYVESDEEPEGSFFSSTCRFDVYGNIISLIKSDNFSEIDELEDGELFSQLFINSNVVNAKDLSLSAKILASKEYSVNGGCYYEMFNGCTNLVTAPELPATTLAYSCYMEMFYGCTSLAQAPKLPATILANNCYQDMFNGCTSLTSAPELPATTLTNCCYLGMFANCTSLTTAPELPATESTEYSYAWYEGMFAGCTSLTTAPELPATTLASQCYWRMFEDCTSLTTAPELPATTLGDWCYQNMFEGCTSLTTAPELPATTLTVTCYRRMFYGCTSLTTAPELPAITLVMDCYDEMFYGCTSLNYIKAMFTSNPGFNYTGGWLYNVAASGTFVKNAAATWTTTGSNGIPNGWTVETATS